MQDRWQEGQSGMATNAEKVAEFIKLRSARDRTPVVCSVALRCYEAGETVAVRAASRREAEEIDEKMWTFSDSVFLPHVIAERAEEPVLEPVLIYVAGQQIGQADVLIEAGGGEPSADALRFAHVIDFAEIYDEALREAGRKRYAALRAAGYRMRLVD
jgi:DNA polymerase-3 subunit chi